MQSRSPAAAAGVLLPWYQRVFHPLHLTWFRIVAVWPILVLLSCKRDAVALGVLIVAEATDYLDGLLARRWNLVSKHGALMDTLADKILHLPLFGYFLFFPKPPLPHFFLIHDLIHWVGYRRLFIVIAAIETVLLATRSGLLQQAIDWAIDKLGLEKHVELRVVKKRDAKIYGKVKTWFHAFSTGFFILATVMLGANVGHFHADIIALDVSAAQILTMVSVVWAVLSLQSRFTLRLGKRAPTAA